MFVKYFRHDEHLLQKNSRSTQQTSSQNAQSSQFHAPLDTQQFGVSLQFIKEHNNGDVIPPVVRQCVEFLSQPDGKF